MSHFLKQRLYLFWAHEYFILYLLLFTIWGTVQEVSWGCFPCWLWSTFPAHKSSQNTFAHFTSIQGVHLIGQEQRQLNACVFGIQQVHCISGSGRLMRQVRGQGRWGAAPQLWGSRVAERERERRRRSSGWPRGAAGQELTQSSLKVSHEEWVDNRIHGAVAIAQPGDGVKEGEGDTLAHGLSKDTMFSYCNNLENYKCNSVWKCPVKENIDLAKTIPKEKYSIMLNKIFKITGFSTLLKCEKLSFCETTSNNADCQASCQISKPFLGVGSYKFFGLSKNIQKKFTEFLFAACCSKHWCCKQPMQLEGGDSCWSRASNTMRIGEGGGGCIGREGGVRFTHHIECEMEG